MVKDVDYSYVFGDDDWTSILLPNGFKFLTSALYSRKESAGVTVLVVVSFISLVAVLGLIVAISMSAFNTRTVAAGEHLFVRTQVATYFVCLLICNMIQSVGSIMNIKWVNEMGVYYGDFCRIQGEVKQTADVGTAIWSLFIATHTFNLLFLKVEMHRFVLSASVILGWALVAAFVIGGPFTVDRAHRGPFYGISGYWCWISEGYPTHRITMDYLVMFICAFLCLILYILTWLRTRGNINIIGGRLRFHKTPPTEHWHTSDTDNSYTRVIAGRMVMYPVAYFLCILPIAICRFTVWSGHAVPFEATIFADTIFLLFGLVNVILFSTTRRMLPPKSIIKWSPSRRRYGNDGGNGGGGSPGSCEKGTKPGELGIFFVEEPEMEKSATWDDSFNIQAHPPTPGPPRSPFAGDASEWEKVQSQASSRAPFTPKPFRLSMSAPRSPVAPRSPIGGGRGWGQAEPAQPFTPRPLRLSMMAPSSPNPAGHVRSPSAPPGLGGAGKGRSESPPESPTTPPAWHDRDGQDVPAEPAAFKPFNLGAAPSGLARKGSRGRGGSGGSGLIGSRMRYITPSPAPPVLEFEDVPSSPFRAVEDELSRISARTPDREGGAWSPSNERAHSPAGRSASPARMTMPVPMPHAASDGQRSASSDYSNYDDEEEEAEPAFEIVHR